MVFLGCGGNYSEVRDREPSLWKKIIVGLEVEDLVRLAKSIGGQAAGLKTRSIGEIRGFVNSSLKAGHPVILGSEPQVHWICLGGRTEDGGYVFADSASSPAVGAFNSWDHVEEWMTVEEGSNEPAELENKFEAIRVFPGKKMQASRSMVPWSGYLWETLAADEDYAMDWSNMLNDMVGVFWDQKLAPDGLDSGEFLDSNIESIVEAVTLHTGCSKRLIRDLANGYRDVAHFHSLVVPATEIPSAAARFALTLAAKANQ